MDHTIFNQLLIYNAQGLIPGPDEEVDMFFKRADYCLSLNEKFKKTSPLSVTPETSSFALEQACLTVFKNYHFSPTWVPLFFCNDRLAPWHAGCTWIFNEQKEAPTEEAPTGAFLQLRAQLKKTTNYLGLYQREELMCHELMHVARMNFNEPKFEEILAYRLSGRAWRRWWGPLFSSSLESLLFVISLLLVICLDSYFLFFGAAADYGQTLWTKAIPAILMLGAVMRLAKRQRVFQQTAQKLIQVTGNQEKAYAVLCRLTDKEIINFARTTAEEIKRYAKTQISLRWKIIEEIYFK